MKPLEDFESKIQIQFQNRKLLQQALTHRSFLNESKSTSIKNNERLEFLGDAVLELITTEYLYNKYPKRPEGELTSFRAAIVRTESLASTALKIDLGEYLLIGKGEELTGGRRKPYILANSFEAIIGAIYLDQGYERAKSFIHKVLIPKLSDIVSKRLDIDPKSKLQELSQEKTGFTPTYELVSASGPDHKKIFTMKILINKNDFGKGKGRSKQDAEQAAARHALKQWHNNYKKYYKK